MQSEIIGGNLPAVLCRLRKGEKIICQGGGMSWMDSTFKMETKTGGIGKMFGRAFTGESLFTNTYTAEAEGEIAFASGFPGQILAIQLHSGKSIIAQKSAFMAMEETVEMTVHFQRKLSGGFFGGEKEFSEFMASVTSTSRRRLRLLGGGRLGGLALLDELPGEERGDGQQDAAEDRTVEEPSDRDRHERADERNESRHESHAHFHDVA